MSEFKGTKGDWEIIEHNWSDTSIISGDKTICTVSIYNEATEETQDELEAEVLANFKVIKLAPRMLEFITSIESSEAPPFYRKMAKQIIKEATE